MGQDQLAVERISIPSDRRVIAISDIHGRSDLLAELLQKVQFCQNDELFLVGDLCEKGPDSLGAVRMAMELVRAGNTHVLMGNCDTVWYDFLDEEPDETLPGYLEDKAKNGSLIIDFARELLPGGREKSHADILQALFPEGKADCLNWRRFRKEAREVFSEELAFLEGCPHIIETEDFLFAHGGINQLPLEKNTPWEVMKNDNFVAKGKRFPKTLIVGHFPVIIYGENVICANPRRYPEQNIICIDGGIQINSAGQLNALILNGAQPFAFEAVDGLSLATVREAQATVDIDPFFVDWFDNEVDVLEWGEEFAYCRQKSTGRELWVARDKLFENENGWVCYCSTNDWLPVCAGDVVSIISRYSDRSFCKLDGRAGWIANEKLAF